jgi:hypothetical protein
VRAVAAALRDPPELLDVHMHELPRPVPLVAHDLAAQLAARRQVDLVQPRLAFAAQHPVHRRGVHAEPMADPGRSPASLAAQVHDPADQRAPDLRRAAVRPARPVLHRFQRVAARLAVAIPGGPPARGLRRGLEALGGSTQRPAVVDDTASQGKTALGSQGGVSVQQEDLRGLGEAVASPTSLGGPLHVRMTRRVTNVRGQYT